MKDCISITGTGGMPRALQRRTAGATTSFAATSSPIQHGRDSTFLQHISLTAKSKSGAVGPLMDHIIRFSMKHNFWETGLKGCNGVRNVFNTVCGLNAPGTKGDEETGMRPTDRGIGWASAPVRDTYGEGSAFFVFPFTPLTVIILFVLDIVLWGVVLGACMLGEDSEIV